MLQRATKFDNVAHEEDWEPRLWPEWKKWATETFMENVSDASATTQSKAKPKKDFGQILVLEEATGLPVVPSEETLQELSNNTTVQYLQQMVREFLTFHYGTCLHPNLPFARGEREPSGRVQ